METWILLLVGILTGILAGMLGLGGGIIFTPVLLEIFESSERSEPHIWAIATSLSCTFIAALSSSIRQHIKGHYDFKRSLMIGLFAIIGLSLGRWILSMEWFNTTVFRIFFSLIIAYVGAQFFLRRNTPEKPITENKTLSWKGSLSSGSAGGFIAVLAGIGGGGVMVPILHFLYGQRLKTAISLSSGAIVWIALFATLSMMVGVNTEHYRDAWTLGYVQVDLAIPLSIGAFAGGFIGVQLSHRVSPKILSSIFSVVMAIMLYRMLSAFF